MPNRHSKLSLLLSLPVVLLVAQGAFAQGQQDFSAVQIKVHQVAGNFYYLEGQGGNVGLLVGDDGDTLSAPSLNSASAQEVPIDP
jgi:hypothetical protein